MTNRYSLSGYYEVVRYCQTCSGTGEIPLTVVTCPACKGAGGIDFVGCSLCIEKGYINLIETCPDCKGEGAITEWRVRGED